MCIQPSAWKGSGRYGQYLYMRGSRYIGEECINVRSFDNSICALTQLPGEHGLTQLIAENWIDISLRQHSDFWFRVPRAVLAMTFRGNDDLLEESSSMRLCCIGKRLISPITSWSIIVPSVPRTLNWFLRMSFLKTKFIWITYFPRQASGCLLPILLYKITLIWISCEEILPCSVFHNFRNIIGTCYKRIYWSCRCNNSVHSVVSKSILLASQRKLVICRTVGPIIRDQGKKYVNSNNLVLCTNCKRYLWNGRQVFIPVCK
jgi:hypothetical protein